MRDRRARQCAGRPVTARQLDGAGAWVASPDRQGYRLHSPAEELFMTDLLIVALTTGLFAATAGLVTLFDRM